MASATRFLASAAVGGLMVVSTTAKAGATEQRHLLPASAMVQVASSIEQGALAGVVEDERGQPVAGAIVSALGGTTTIAITDKAGRFEFATLPPGPYVLRAHLAGFIASRSQVVDVGPSARATSRIALRRATSPQILAAGVSAVEQPGAAPSTADTDDAAVASRADDDHSETAWRLRHARRGVLKDTSIPIELLLAEDDEFVDDSGAPLDVLRREFAASARSTGSFFAGTPFSGQVNLLTTSSFDTPQQLFSPDFSARNIAYASLAAPVGGRGDWMVRGAINQSDISSWTVAGSYTTRAPARHRYSMGLSYSTQRYDGGNPLALRDLTDGSRNAGEVYAYDEFALLPGLTVAYGTGYAHYDYLASGNLLSPRLDVTITPLTHTRVSGSISSRATAPGAEEFLPPSDTGLWLPPQRTFSSIERRVGFEAERTNTTQVAVERDLGVSTVTFRAFRQRVDGQLATVFGGSLPGQPDASLGHYLAGNAGDADVTGYAAGFQTVVASRFKGSIEYTCANGQIAPASHVRYLMLLAPSSIRTSERVHDVSTAVETDVPETATRITVLYRISDGFSRPANGLDSGYSPRVDGRFDVQIRQSLPFMSFTNAHWEMLLAVRNFFRAAGAEQSFYDELLVVRPPKRVVGGVTLRF